MPRRDIIVIGASAGGLDALRAVVGGLPPDLGAAVFVVQHFPPQSVSVLPRILSREGPLPAIHAVDGDRIEPSRIYVARPNLHLTLGRDRMHLTRGPRENRHRPAVDPLFRSAARWHGNRVIGVVLSGSLDDGTMGLAAIKAGGGIAIVQDPTEALYPSMPSNAMEHVEVDRALPASEIAEALVDYTLEEVEDPPVTDNELDEPDGTIILSDGQTPNGQVSFLTCPECHGALWEMSEGDLVRYRCHVGHLYSPESLAAEQAEKIEDALWIAYRALQENAALTRRLADSARKRGATRSANRFEAELNDTAERAHLLKDVLIAGLIRRTSTDEMPPNSAKDDRSGDSSEA